MVQTLTIKLNSAEAKKQLDDLLAEQKSLVDLKKKAQQMGDGQAAKAAEKRLKEVNNQIKQLQTTAKNVDDTFRNLSSASVKDIQFAIKETNKLLNSGAIERGSKEWKDLQSKLAAAKQELKGIRDESNATQDAGDKLKESFTSIAAKVMLVVGAITQVIAKLREYREEAMAREESAANLKALTGLDDESVEWLNQQASELATTMDDTGMRIRQSSQEILEAYAAVGSAKPELLSDKEALKDVTVEAIRLATAAKMDLSPAVQGLTTALNQFGAGADEAQRYVNVLAAGSKAGAAGVEEQAAALKNAGVAAGMANLTIEETTALIETLAEKGLKAENAGTGLKSFLSKLETGADATKPSVVGLQKALENLAEHENDTAWLLKNFGEGAVNTAAILIQNRDAVQSYTEAVTDTNTALEQAAINSDTAAAKSAQLKNQISEAGQQIVAAITPLYEITGKTVAVVMQAIAWIVQYKIALTALAVGIGIVTAAAKIDVATKKLQVFWTKVIVAETKKMWQTLTKHPYAAIAAAVVFLVGVLAEYLTRITSINKAQENLNKIKDEAIAKTELEKDKLMALRDVAKDESATMEMRINAVNELNKIIPNYNAQIDATTGKYRESKKALDAYIRSLEHQYQVEGAKSLYASLGKDYAQLLADRNKALRELETTQKMFNGYTGGASTTAGTPLNIGQGEIARAEGRIKDLDRAIKDKKNEITSLAKTFKEIYMEGDVSAPSAPVITTPTAPPAAPSASSGRKSSSKSVAKSTTAINRIEAREDAEKLALKKQYYQDALMSEQDYQNKIQEIELKALNDKLAVAGLEEAQRMSIMNKIYDIQQARREEEHEKEMSFERKKLEDKIEALTLSHYTEQTSEDDYRQAVKEATVDYYNEMLDRADLSTEEKAALLRERNDIILDDAKEHYELMQEEQNKSYEKMKATISDYSDAVAEVFADLFSGELNSFKDFAKEMIIAAVEMVEKVVDVCIVESLARNLAKNITKYGGLIGIAKAVAEAAAIKVAFAAIKAGIKGFEEGGFTDKNVGYSEVAGVVHGGEFVANHNAVNNPNILPILQSIDRAQKNNTVGSWKPDTSVAVAAAQDNRRLEEALQRLTVILDGGIEAYAVLDGESGFHSRYTHYKKLIKEG